MIQSIVKPIEDSLRHLLGEILGAKATIAALERTLLSMRVGPGLYGVERSLERAWLDACELAQQRAVIALQEALAPPGVPLEIGGHRPCSPPRLDEAAQEDGLDAFMRELSARLEIVREAIEPDALTIAWDQLAGRIASFWRLWCGGRTKPAWRKLGARTCLSTPSIGKGTATAVRHLQDLAQLLHREGLLADPQGAADRALETLDAAGWNTSGKIRASLGGHVEVRLYPARTDWVLSDAAFGAVNLLMAERRRDAA